ncbi:hypothetical protein FHS43_006268 [Streptosporangium becharense]|uniref:Uncharacterized protein n=1 Tax=Streptosporangium becharense TaxID=1816182 RepID=A0A7W9IGG6_9ACTN|nr:hypothetical protein [Streptosporangium becharense]MBB5820233.1 hypothetical protein [Streptosporangium becharense]
MTVDTLDNPGWRLKADLVNTSLAGVLPDRLVVERAKDDWGHARNDGIHFEGAYGPLNLGEVSEAFRDSAGNAVSPLTDALPGRAKDDCPGSPCDGIRHNHRMFNFGIPGYRPEWLSGRSSITAVHGARLGRLVDRRLTRALLVWDLDEDKWFADCPVLLDFEGEQVEINHWKFDELSITWNTIDPVRSPDWPDFHLAWRDDVPDELTALVGQPCSAVDLLMWRDRDLVEGTIVSLGFGFPNGQVTIYNALDENGMEFTPPDDHYTRYSLAF